MFTGIIKHTAKVVDVKEEGTNVHFTLQSPIANELSVDQSVAHNGVCLTVVDVQDDKYVVTAIEETLDRSALNDWKTGTLVNLERSLRMGDRLDGHMVQGHVDTTAELLVIDEKEGSWRLTFSLPEKYRNLVVEKGSIAVNGVSLTVAAVTTNSFTVAIIPYTWQHTNFHKLWVGEQVNIEFDIAAKYFIQSVTPYLVQS